ncbi:MAG: 2-dehydropantoate 2-reductase [Leptolinea sp.]|jgi:2-dehydropantoate 2-reductase|nr:2-dehydropantoate 2-reductase [Leptolinea sp.]
MTEDILIIGSGALACLFAARLTCSGTPVTLTGTFEAAMKTIRGRGIGLIEAGVTTFIPVATLDPSSSIKRFSKAILLTKAYQTTSSLKRVKPNLDEKGSVLSLQNGLTPRDQMISVIGEKRTISGITLCAGEQIEPGVVKHNGGKDVVIGQHPDTAYYRDILSGAGFTVTVTGDIRKMIWEKAIINSAANPLAAIMRYPNGKVYNSPDLMSLIDELIQEACQVARADGCPVNDEELRDRIRQILRDTSANRCSMLQDVINRRSTEIDDLNGAIINKAKKLGISTPVHRTITHLVRSIHL